MLKMTQLDLIKFYKNDIILNLVNLNYNLFNLNQLRETKKLFKAMPKIKKQYINLIKHKSDTHNLFCDIKQTDNVINAFVAYNAFKFDSNEFVLSSMFYKLRDYCLANNIKQINMGYDLRDNNKLFSSIYHIADKIFNDEKYKDKIVFNICLVLAL